ncbi:MAG: acylphosphatase [Candidatus Eremiobacteraeota bacterium]|nr:acylphosphatase [Candidatus Eremiobacteraeota bacterium]
MQLHCFFSGLVQGVGFRHTARKLARELGVKGWVMNLPDGRVELVAEADDEVLASFLERLRGFFRAYIQHEDLRWGDVSGEFSDFGVRF